MIKSTFMDYITQKLQSCHEYVEALQKEHKKIQVFQSDIPLCLELVSKVIEICRKDLSGMSLSENGNSKCYERTRSDYVFEEFIPMKCSSSSSDKAENSNKDEAEDNNDDENKSDWLQLWNQSPNPQPKVKEKPVADSQQVKTNTPTTSSTAESVKREVVELKQSKCRKPRRCWSQDLHRRFLHALKHLGGSKVATPKQIRDLMKVDGLSNDEVKSHLQKYRLHTRRRRPVTPAVINGGEIPRQPQLMMVKGICVPTTFSSMRTPQYFPPQHHLRSFSDDFF